MRVPNWWKDYKRLAFVDSRWLTIWIIIYLCFLTLDIIQPDLWVTSVLKYTGIFLCVIYAHQKFPKDYNLQLALVFTLLADTLLVWTPYAIAGVFVFCFAQFLHIIRLSKLPNYAIIIFAAFISMTLIISPLWHLNPLYVLAVVYALSIFNNLGIAIRRYRNNPRNFQTRCALYGFIAFVCCDVCVMLRFLAYDGSLPANFITLTSFLVWVFYYPSQVLIANSSIQKPISVGGRFAKNKRIS